MQHLSPLIPGEDRSQHVVMVPTDVMFVAWMLFILCMARQLIIYSISSTPL